jgi:hypothetical protein
MSDAVRYRSKRDSAPYRSALLRTASSQLLMAQHERKLSGHDGGLPKQIEDDSWEKGSGRQRLNAGTPATFCNR